MQSALGSSVFVQLRGGRTGLAVQACRDLHVNRVTSDTGASPGNYARVSPQSRVAARSLLAATRAVQGEGSGGPDDTRNPAIGHFARNVQNTIKLFRLVPGGGVEPPWPQGPADFESFFAPSNDRLLPRICLILQSPGVHGSAEKCTDSRADSFLFDWSRS